MLTQFALAFGFALVREHHRAHAGGDLRHAIRTARGRSRRSCLPHASRPRIVSPARVPHRRAPPSGDHHGAAAGRRAAMSFLVQRSDVGEFRRRYKWMALFAVLAFGVLLVRLFQLQVVEGDDYAPRRAHNIIYETRLATTRGVIRDAQGKSSPRAARRTTCTSCPRGSTCARRGRRWSTTSGSRPTTRPRLENKLARDPSTIPGPQSSSKFWCARTSRATSWPRSRRTPPSCAGSTWCPCRSATTRRASWARTRSATWPRSTPRRSRG